MSFFLQKNIIFKLINGFNDYIYNTSLWYKSEGSMTTEPISVTIQKCIENDRIAQHELFRIYRKKIYDIVYKSLGNSFDSDDIVQQIFIAIFKSLSSFKGKASFDTWIYRISLKICSTQLRKKYRKRQPSLVYTNSGDDVADLNSWSSPDETIEQKELSRTIYEALDKLSTEKRMIVVLYEMEGKSIDEIAAIVNKPVGTVKSRLFHGRKALVKHLRGILI
jgi:RNA polymerase sigma-70 factor, ECF subfamily